MRGPGSPRPLDVAKRLVFLCHIPCMTLWKERLTEPRLRGSTEGACLLAPGPWMASRLGGGQGSGTGFSSIGSRAEVLACSGLHDSLV